MFANLPTYNSEDDPFEYLVKTFVPSIIQSFKDQGYLRTYDKESNGQQKGGEFIIAFNGRLFTIHDDFQVEEVIDNFTAIGCGAKYALGALEAINDDPMWPQDLDRITRSLEIAEKFSAGVSRPFNIIKINN